MKTADSARPPKQPNIAILRHREAWPSKPVLREAYPEIFRGIAARRENSCLLNFADTPGSHPILFEVWHHLRYLGPAALREFHDALVARLFVVLEKEEP